MYVKMQTTSFSGATLIALLLGAHPEISTVGEMNGLRDVDVDTYLCSCGEKIVECEFWQSATEKMHGQGFAFDIGNFDTRFVFDDRPFVHALQQRSFGNETIDALRDSLILRWPKEHRRIKMMVARNEALIEAIQQKTGIGSSSTRRKRPSACARFTSSLSSISACCTWCAMCVALRRRWCGDAVKISWAMLSNAGSASTKRCCAHSTIGPSRSSCACATKIYVATPKHFCNRSINFARSIRRSMLSAFKMFRSTSSGTNAAAQPVRNPPR